MALNLFYQLSKEKRQRILDASKQEFTESGFEKASINKIIDKAGIARGSFYLYFEDKTDIYYETILHEQKKVKEASFKKLNCSNIEDFPILLFDYYVKAKDLDKQFACKIFHDLTPAHQDFFRKNAINIKYLNDVLISKYNDEEESEIIKNLLFSSLVRALIKVNVMNQDIKQSRNILLREVEIIKKGNKWKL